MKTNLPVAITTPEQAKAFLKALSDNGEVFHPEDDANDIVWNGCPDPTPEEADQLNKLMGDIYNLPGNDGRHNSPLAFDPCLFLMDLENTGTFTVSSSNGIFEVDVKTGDVVTLEIYPEEDYKPLQLITSFDLKEWEKFYPEEKITRYSRLDILDLGYTSANYTYKEPAHNWREEVKRMRQ